MQKGETADVRYVGTGEACRVLGCCGHTLRAWAKAGRIDAIRWPGGKFGYNVSEFIRQGREALAAREARKLAEREAAASASVKS